MIEKSFAFAPLNKGAIIFQSSYATGKPTAPSFLVSLSFKEVLILKV
jgi:hypothetical protein